MEEFLNVSHIKNSGGSILLLAKEKAYQRLNQRLPIKLQDGTQRIVAYHNDKMIICAKEYIYGNIVSANKQLILFAHQNKLRLVMYIKDADKFYEFNPAQCIKEGKGNIRGGITMWNFEIKLGTNVEK